MFYFLFGRLRTYLNGNLLFLTFSVSMTIKDDDMVSLKGFYLLVYSQSVLIYQQRLNIVAEIIAWLIFSLPGL